LVLAFLPFEKAFYDKFNVPCQFVGHTLADQLPLLPDKNRARAKLGLSANDRLLAILPGSRKAEVELLAPIFLQSAAQLSRQHPGIKFIVPMVNEARKKQFAELQKQYAPDLELTLFDGQAGAVLQSADAVLLASGTAALEAMLAKTPMVVAYRVKPLTYMIAKALVKVKYTSLPNLIADREVVKELSQHDCKVENIVAELNRLLSEDNQQLINTFTQLHRLIKCDADTQAARAVAGLLDKR
jgi:lipid-A-disaccharide synthase